MLVSASWSAQARADFEPSSRAWSGLSGLVALAREHGVDLVVPERLDLSSLRSTDGVLLVHPEEAPPAPDLVAFMREGGRLAIADDVGASESLLEVFRIQRHAPTAPRESLGLRDSRNVLIALPRNEHPLSASVHALVVNHTKALHHESLQPIFALTKDRDSVVLAGAVGDGRLVAISDSSVLINNMLELKGNRVFAANLLAYLARDGRVYLVPPKGAFAGSYGGADAQPGGLSARLRELGSRALPPRTLLLLTLGIAGMLLFVAATSLPQRATYLRDVTLRAPEVTAGFAGRVAFFAKPGHNLLPPLMSYKQELEREMLERLRLPANTALSEVVAALRRAGLSQALADDAHALLRELQALRLSQDRPSAHRVIGRRRFRALLARGERILAAIDAG